MRVAMLVLVLVQTAAATAGAADPPGAADAEQRAYELYEQGQALYVDGKYEEALASFLQAYEVQPVPALLYNIGQCHRRLKQHEQAVEAFERYLREANDIPSPNRSEVTSMLEEERDLVARAQADANASAAAGGQPLAADGTVSDGAAPATPARELWEEPLVWAGAAGAVVLVVGAVAAIALASQPAPIPEGSLGNVDLR